MLFLVLLQLFTSAQNTILNRHGSGFYPNSLFKISPVTQKPFGPKALNPKGKISIRLQCMVRFLPYSWNIFHSHAIGEKRVKKKCKSTQISAFVECKDHAIE
jgi:hypothetical protein